MHAEQQIAIVGTACRFPGGSDPNGFWKLLTEGREAIVPVPSDRWDPESRLDPERKIPTVGGFLDEIDEFDATFFGISPREAENIDPQQRIMLEMSWRALEDAGITATSLARTRTGVYLGAEWHDYELVGRDLGSAITPHTGPGNALDMLSSRISYFLELTGPSVVTETGCSSSLVAVHNACRALVTGEVDTAITGGVNLLLHPHGSVTLAHFGGLSVERRCKAFGAGADGFVRAEGAAALLLKRLDRALEDGDRVQAIIQHTHVNNDGGGQSVVAPNPEGQEDLLRSVYPHGGIDADDLAYVEAHGTGTALGDPVEAGALGRVLGRRRSPERGPLPIGSVKTNVGHLEAASGMPALFKALLSLRHRVVPSSLHADTLNPEIPFEELNIDVVREPLTLPPTGDLFIGVNSFGWGGTNAHVLLRSAPPSPTETERTPVSAPYFLPLSAHSQDALTQRAEQIRTTLEETALEGVTGTLTHARDHFPVRAAIVVDDDLAGKEELERYLHSPEAPPPGVPAGRSLPVGRVAFVFPGQGSQWEHMGCELWEASPVFADTIHRCAEALAPYVDWDLKAVLAGHAGPEWMERIDMLQPTLWAVSLGLFEMWRHAGIVPDVVVGHSQGEITAATAAGILDLEEGAKIVARRSAIARRTSGKGRMLAVDLGIEEARAALVGFEESVSVAVNNGPRSCVLSGETDMVLALKDILEVDGVYCRLVNVDYASHSPQMDPLEKDLLEALAGIEPTRGTIPLASTVRPEGVEGTQMDARYWVDNLRRPVLFADTLGDLLDEEVTHVVEVSPHPVLVPAVEQLAAERGEPTRVLSTLRRNEGSPRCFQTSLAQAYVAGLEPFATLPPHTWSPVPGYPWQRESHWVRAGRRRVDPRSVTAPKLTPSLSEPDTWEARSDVALGDIPWARDHRVHDITVLCGTGMMDLALRTARARTGTGHGVLVDVQFRETLPLGETPLALAQRWREDDHGGGTFTLLSLPEGANRWRDHMSARVLLDPAPPQDVPFPEHLSSLPTTGTEEFYATCLSRGLDYGPAFRSVRTLHLGQEEALAELVLPKDCPPVEGPHLVHPALWDGAL